MANRSIPFTVESARKLVELYKASDLETVNKIFNIIKSRIVEHAKNGETSLANPFIGINDNGEENQQIASKIDIPRVSKEKKKLVMQKFVEAGFTWYERSEELRW